MGLATILAELADAAGFGPELIAFIAGTGGTLFGAGMVIGVANKRLADAEKAVASAAEACKTATANAARVEQLEQSRDKLKKRLGELDSSNKRLHRVVQTLLSWMRHAGESSIPQRVLDDISDVLAVPDHRDHQESI